MVELAAPDEEVLAVFEAISQRMTVAALLGEDVPADKVHAILVLLLDQAAIAIERIRALELATLELQVQK